MNNTKSPTILEIASDYKLWSEYVDPLGLDSEEQFAEQTVQSRIELMQNCGWSSKLRGDVFTDDGFIAMQNVEVEIYASSTFPTDAPLVRIHGTVHRTDELEFSDDEITGPGGWYVVIRGTEGGAAE